MPTNVKIKFLTFASSEDDKRTWSGTIYMAYNALKNHFATVEFMCCSPKVPTWHKALCALFKFFKQVHFTNKTFAYNNSYLYRNLVAKVLKKYDYGNYDILFVVAHSVIISALPPTNTPIVYMTDATYKSLVNYYPEMRNIYLFSSRQAIKINKEAWGKSQLIITSSLWAKENAIEQYGISEDKIEVVELGANLAIKEEYHQEITYSDKSCLNIFFSGVDWVRKGGDIAVSCCKTLIDLGINVKLTITGLSLPKEYENYPFINPLGYLNKNDEKDYDTYIKALQESDLHIFPTRAECAGVVTCEAAAFGIPTITYDTGGVANYVTNGVNGYRLPLSATGEDFAACIYKLYNNNELDSLSKGALKIYKEKLNWNIWSDRVASLLTKMVLDE